MSLKSLWNMTRSFKSNFRFIGKTSSGFNFNEFIKLGRVSRSPH